MRAGFPSQSSPTSGAGPPSLGSDGRDLGTFFFLQKQLHKQQLSMHPRLTTRQAFHYARNVA
eukprot:12931905-Prorocentrum_lima.AAC.1